MLANTITGTVGRLTRPTTISIQPRRETLFGVDTAEGFCGWLEDTLDMVMNFFDLRTKLKKVQQHGIDLIGMSPIDGVRSARDDNQLTVFN